MIEVKFKADTRPRPQGSLKSFIIEGKLDVRNPCDRNGRPNWDRKPRVVSTSDTDDLQYFRDFVGYAAKGAINHIGYDAPMAKKHEPVELIIEFVFVRPKTVEAGRDMVVKPDIDKLERALLDSLTGILYVDDAQVVAVQKRKRYGQHEEVRVHAAVIRDATLFDVLLHDAVHKPDAGKKALLKIPKPRKQVPRRRPSYVR